MKQNYENFRNMLRCAICNRTQAQFAQESGLSAEHLSRMLNQDEIHRPQKGTLIKIASAAKNGVTLQDLEDALDGDDGTKNHASEKRMEEAVKDFTPTFRELADNTMAVLANTTAVMPYPFIVSSISEQVGILFEHFADDCGKETLPIAYEIGEERENFGTFMKNAKRWVPVQLSMASFADIAESCMLVYFDELPCSDGQTRYIIHNITCRAEALIDQYGLSMCDLDLTTEILEGKREWPDGVEKTEELPEDKELAAMALAHILPYTLSFQPKRRFMEIYHPKDAASSEERVLKTIFGEKEQWLETFEGFGFWLEDVPANLADFIVKHSTVLLDEYEPLDEQDEELKKNYEQLKEILSVESLMSTEAASALDELKFQDNDMNDDEGYGSAIATIMRAATGFPFVFHINSEEDMSHFDGLSANGCIMIDVNEMENIRRETLIHVVCRYARILGIKKFGDLLFTGVHTAYRKPMTYVVKEKAEDEDIAEDVETFEYVPFDKEKGLCPEKTGGYMVRLKDGREMKMLWISTQGVWVRAHKEWSPMVGEYCPNMLVIEEKKE